MPKLEIKRSDIVFEIITDEEKLGELALSRGSLDFYPKNSKKKHYSVTLKELTHLLEKYGNLRP
jgi:hypothetical protein